MAIVVGERLRCTRLPENTAAIPKQILKNTNSHDNNTHSRCSAMKLSFRTGNFASGSPGRTAMAF
jgi:hypothetical protein